VLHRARQILSQVDQLKAELSEYSSGRKGHVRIQASASSISQVLPADLASFATLAPEVVIAMEERFSGEIVQALREGTTDIGVIMEGTPMDGLEWFDYKADKLVAVVPKKHPLRSRSVVFSALLENDFVTLESATATTRLLIDRAAVARKPLRARIQVHSFAALCKMIEGRVGHRDHAGGRRAAIRRRHAASIGPAERSLGETAHVRMCPRVRVAAGHCPKTGRSSQAAGGCDAPLRTPVFAFCEACVDAFAIPPGRHFPKLE
jgi:hypothetical protein